MAILGPGSWTSLRWTPTATSTMHIKRRSAAFAALSPRRNDNTVNWVEATNSFFEKDSRPIMLFDGVCNLCNGGVRFVRDNDGNRRIRYEALQSEAGRKLLRRSGRAPDDISSVVLVERDSLCLLVYRWGLCPPLHSPLYTEGHTSINLSLGDLDGSSPHQHTLVLDSRDMTKVVSELHSRYLWKVKFRFGYLGSIMAKD
ncbi:unnamed protein product [Dovyalis caffra]|uniref:Uncharacterized protein n=1 Tax=Dovyalis caffra TaxID=77055 RepID=A0AAV1RGV0_9ROSI|nr:unnamed protein product [Dovyalis caffra]